jgi:hypothetical protein
MLASLLLERKPTMSPRQWAHLRSLLFAVFMTVASAAPVVAQDRVRIVNTPQAPVPTRQTDLPAFQPVQRTGNVPGGVREVALYTVPAGKRLVIEYVEGEVGWQTTVGGVTVAYFPSAPAGAEGQMIRIYADPGTRVFAVRRATSRMGTQPLGRFSGYLVDLP